MPTGDLFAMGNELVDLKATRPLSNYHWHWWEIGGDPIVESQNIRQT